MDYSWKTVKRKITVGNQYNERENPAPTLYMHAYVDKIIELPCIVQDQHTNYNRWRHCTFNDILFPRKKVVKELGNFGGMFTTYR